MKLFNPKHFFILKQWFKEDPEVLGRLQYCSKNETTPKNKEFFLWLKMATTDNNIKIGQKLLVVK